MGHVVGNTDLKHFNTGAGFPSTNQFEGFHPVKFMRNFILFIILLSAVRPDGTVDINLEDETYISVDH